MTTENARVFPLVVCTDPIAPLSELDARRFTLVAGWVFMDAMRSAGLIEYSADDAKLIEDSVAAVVAHCPEFATSIQIHNGETCESLVKTMLAALAAKEQ